MELTWLRNLLLLLLFLLVVKFLKQFQTNEVDQNHLDWMGFIFSCWKVYGFEEYFRLLLLLLFIYWLWSLKKKIQIDGVDGNFRLLFWCAFAVLLLLQLRVYYSKHLKMLDVVCFSIIMLFWSGVYYNLSFLHMCVCVCVCVFFFFLNFLLSLIKFMIH